MEVGLLVKGVTTLVKVGLKGVSEVAILVKVGLKGVSLCPGGPNSRKGLLKGRKRGHIPRKGRFKGRPGGPNSRKGQLKGRKRGHIPRKGRFKGRKFIQAAQGVKR